MTTNTWLWQLPFWLTPCVSHYIHYKIEICIFLNWSACEVREHSYGFHWLRKARKHRFRHSHSLNFGIHNFLKTTGFSLFYMINIDVDRVVFSTFLGSGLALGTVSHLSNHQKHFKYGICKFRFYSVLNETRMGSGNMVLVSIMY